MQIRPGLRDQQARAEYCSGHAGWRDSRIGLRLGFTALSAAHSDGARGAGIRLMKSTHSFHLFRVLRLWPLPS